MRSTEASALCNEFENVVSLETYIRLTPQLKLPQGEGVLAISHQQLAWLTPPLTKKIPRISCLV
jgi:hypothetical protein